MTYEPSILSLHCCPFVEEGYAACSSKFTLGQLDQACSICFGAYKFCSMYKQLTSLSKDATSDLTINGYGIELRPTGS